MKLVFDNVEELLNSVVIVKPAPGSRVAVLAYLYILHCAATVQGDMHGLITFSKSV